MRNNVKSIIVVLVSFCGILFLFLCSRATVGAVEKSEEIVLCYEEYEQRFAAIENVQDIEANGLQIITAHVFPVLLESFGEEEVTFLPAMDNAYHRLAIFIADSEGKILYKTNQLETNYLFKGSMKQPTTNLAAVSFRDANQDGLTDIILITKCVNDTGDYAGKPYKTGDVLFQKEKGFYRDYRGSAIVKIIAKYGKDAAPYLAEYVRSMKEAVAEA